MKKIIVLILSTIVLLPLQNKAQDESAFEKGTVVATVGYGFPDLYRTSLRVAYGSYSSRTVRGFGPLLLKGDYGIIKFKWGHAVGAGIVIGYSSTSVTYNYNDYVGYPYYNNAVYTQKDKYNTITIGARGTYHFFTKEKFDCYASIGLGYNINTYSYSTNNPNGQSYRSASSRAGIYSAFTVGIRYFFTPNIGVYSELGWDASAPIQGGLALKF